MKRNKGLIVMSAVTLIAVAAALLDFKREHDEESRKEEESIVLTMKPDQISEVEFLVTSPNFVLQKSSEGWKFAKPREEMADSAGVSEFLESLAEEKGIELSGLANPPVWSKFGLEKPKGSLIFKDQLGKIIRVDVGTKKNFEGAVYLRKNHDNKVLMGSPGWASKMDLKIFDFRDKRLLRKEPNQIERFAVTKGQETYEFVFTEGKWVLQGKLSWKLDQNRVQQLINTLTGNVIIEYLKEGSILPDDRKKFGILQAEVRVKVLLRGNANWNALVGSLKDGGYPVEIQEPALIVRMAAVYGEKLLKLRPEDLRDRFTPFEFDKNEVEKIELKYSDKALELVKKDKVWTILRGEGAQIDVATVPDLIEKIRKLEATEFLDGGAELKAGAELQTGSPKSLHLSNGQGKIIMELELGPSKKRKVNGVDRIYYTAQSSLVGELLTIDEARIKDLGIDQIFGGKTGAKK